MADLPESITPEMAEAAGQTIDTLFALIRRWHDGDTQGASDTIGSLPHDELRALAGGLLGLASGAVTALALLAEIDTADALAVLMDSTVAVVAGVKVEPNRG